MAKLGDAMRGRLDAAEQRITELAADNAALRAQVGEQKAHIARLQDEATKLQEEVVKLRSEGVELRSDVSAVRAAIQVVDFEGLVVHALHTTNIRRNPHVVMCVQWPSPHSRLMSPQPSVPCNNLYRVQGQGQQVALRLRAAQWSTRVARASGTRVRPPLRRRSQHGPAAP